MSYFLAFFPFGQPCFISPKALLDTVLSSFGRLVPSFFRRLMLATREFFFFAMQFPDASAVPTLSGHFVVLEQLLQVAMIVRKECIAAG